MNPEHPLKLLADRLDWTFFEEEFGKCYKAGKGHPPKPIRLMVGLLMLQHMFKMSDEKVVLNWVENPYWQYFCGYDYARWKPPVNPCSLTRFRQRLGEKGLRKVLQATVQEGLRQGAIKASELKKVTVDTTAMEKNITFPSDTKNLNKARKNLVKQAQKHKIKLRQNYEKVGKKEAWKASRKPAMKTSKHEEKVNNPFIERTQFLSKDFVLSAGVVIFNKALNKVCLIKNSKGEFLLPKGRKNIGETLSQAALREAYEETGFPCKLLPSTMKCRATLVTSTKDHIPDIAHICKGITEPVAISMRSNGKMQKIIFWFIAVEEGTYHENTPMANEKFAVDFYTFDNAMSKLIFKENRALVKSAINIVLESKST